MAEEARALNSNIKTEVVELDVSKAAPSAYQALFNERQRTSIVVNNAGIMKNRLLLEQKPELLEAMIKTNVHPYIYMTKYAMKHFKEHKEGHQHKTALLYTSSLAAEAWLPNMGVYAGTKMHNASLARMVS